MTHAATLLICAVVFNEGVVYCTLQYVSLCEESTKQGVLMGEGKKTNTAGRKCTPSFGLMQSVPECVGQSPQAGV